MKFFCLVLVALALLVLFPVTVSGSEEGKCSFGMILNDDNISMRWQCNDEKPVDMDKCETIEMKGEKDKVFLVITCCSVRSYCMSVTIPTDKVGI